MAKVNKQSRLLQQTGIDGVTVNPEDSHVRAFRVQRVEENVPGGGHDDGRHAKQRRPAGSQPSIAGPAGRGQVRRPLVTERAGVYVIDGQHIRRLDLEIQEFRGYIFYINPGVHQHFKKGRGRVGSAIDHAPPLRMPSPRRA